MKEPRIKDFELTETQLKHYEIVSFYSSNKFGISFLIIWIIIFAIFIINRGMNSESIMYGIMLGLFVAFWGAFLFSSLVPFSYDLVKNVSIVIIKITKNIKFRKISMTLGGLEPRSNIGRI
jgi:hypothetical protein